MILEFISLESDLVRVMNDEVMRGFRRSLKPAICCEDDILPTKKEDEIKFDFPLCRKK